MNTKRTLIRYFLTGFTVIALSSPAFAVTEPQEGKADPRVKTLTYRENDVFELKGHYGFTTMIELSPKERIETTSIGDSEAWQVIPSGQRGNILFIKPLEPNAETNMTVLTNRHIYAFEMAADTASSSKSEDLAFRLRFLYPEDAESAAKSKKPEKYDPLADQDISDWNFNYAYSGDRRLRPSRAFDDGTFTYLEFGRQDVTPAVFAVDAKGRESLVNFNVQGSYLVIERIGQQFTLRDGETATCIFNESYESKSGTQKQKVKIAVSQDKPVKASAVVPGTKPKKTTKTETESPTEKAEAQSVWDSLGAQPVLASHLNP